MAAARRSWSQLLHILDLGRGDLTSERPLQARTVLLQQLDCSANLPGGITVELPQLTGLVGELDGELRDRRKASFDPAHGRGTNADVQLCEGRVVPAVTITECRCRGRSLSPSGYPGNHPCPTKGAAIQSHNDEDQSTLQRGTLGVGQERHGEAELRWVGHS